MATKKRKTKLPKWVVAVLALMMIGGAYLLYIFMGPNTGSFTEGAYLYIPTGARYADVLKALQKGAFIDNIKSFEAVAQRAGYPEMVKAGRYHIKPGMGNLQIVRMLRSGAQEPVKVVINKLRTPSDLYKLLQKNLEPDSNAFKVVMANEAILADYKLNQADAMCAIMPNTYELYWNTTAEKAFKKIAKTYVNFWTEVRQAKAKQLQLTPQQVIILSSIVEEETNKQDEKGKIASVYLNRLHDGMKLQADPTARYAGGDFTIKRITSKQTSITSPYNTYYVTGLPPGPICTPSGKTIDAVLEAPHTDFLYFSAKEDFSGYHNFAANYNQHLANATKYHQALNAKNIK